MPYQSLYRRYRPRRFSEIVGQDHIVNALRSSVRDGRVGHAYLFSGPRGTGKTSTARILAKALNCEDLQDGEPCCVCDSCKAIEAGVSYDLQELDAASNNKVEDVRDLVGKVALGSPGRTKVYILDEVHMLTTQASNALLKTLEEPPPHVRFVLATTDPHKVLPTIRSRTQHHQFTLLPADRLAEHVAWVIKDAGLTVDESGLQYVLRIGGGSARDTLSALDQVAASGGGAVTAGRPVEALLEALVGADAGGALAAVSDAVAAGRDPRVLGEELLAGLRDVFLVRMGAVVDHLPDTEQGRVKAWAERMGDRATTRALEAVGEALLEMRQAPDPRIPLEVALVRLTRPGADASIDALVERVERLEQALVKARPEMTQPASAPPAASPGGGSPGLAPVGPEAPTEAAGPLPAPTVGPPAPVVDRPERPAAAARAALADRRPPSTASPRPKVAAPVEPAASPPPPHPRSGSGPKDRASTGPPPPAVAPDAPTSADRPPAGGLFREQLTIAWADAVLPTLGGLAKAMYSIGRFLEVDGQAAVFALPNEAHRRKCDQKRAEVEQALSNHVGRPVTLRLVVDDGRAGARPEAGADDSPPEADDEEDFAGLDPRSLEDAPADHRDEIDRLTEAFPGAELIEQDEPT